MPGVSELSICSKAALPTRPRLHLRATGTCIRGLPPEGEEGPALGWLFGEGAGADDWRDIPTTPQEQSNERQNPDRHPRSALALLALAAAPALAASHGRAVHHKRHHHSASLITSHAAPGTPTADPGRRTHRP